MNLEDRDGLIWLDGALVPWREARVHVLSQTLHHGMGAFEGVRAYDGENGVAVFRLREHTRRLFNSCKIIGLTLPWTPEQIDEACLAVIRANGYGGCYLRPIVFLGGEKPGVSAAGNSIHAAVIAWPWEDYLGAGAAQLGVRLKVSSFSRHHHNAVLLKAKANGLYINSMLANQEARSLGFDDALMLDVAGFVAEASTSNIFVVRDGEIATPPRTSVLEGITRASVIALLADLGHPVVERHLTRDELYIADEAFLTGTASELTPVSSVDDRPLNTCPGPLTLQVQTAFQAAVRGRARDRLGWLTPVGPGR